jgi:hypothetical protein
MEEKEWYWDWIKHEGNIFTNRGNFFLVAESMLLVAVFALAAGSNHQESFLLLSYIGGIFVILIWLYVNCKHKKTQAIIVNKYKELCPQYNKIKSNVKMCPWCIANHTMMGIILPFGFLIIWVTLLSAFRNPWC